MQPLSEARPYARFTNHLNSLPFLAAIQQTSGLFPIIQSNYLLFSTPPASGYPDPRPKIRGGKDSQKRIVREHRRKRGCMRKLALLLATLFLVANGCVISPRRTVNGSGSGGSNSEFSLSANPTSQSISPGAAATFTISVQAVNGFTGTVTLRPSSPSSSVAASFDTTSITCGSGSAVLTVSTTSTTPTGNVTITVTASATANNVSHNVSITASVHGAASIASALVPTVCVTSPAGSGIQRVSFPATPGDHGFTTTFDATPSTSAMDASLGFFSPTPGTQPALSEIIHFSPAGFIQAANGDALVPSNLPYAAGQIYHFRLTENLPAATYSLFVTPPGAAEIPLGTNLQVPSDQRGATTLTGLGLLLNGPADGTLSVCNFALR